MNLPKTIDGVIEELDRIIDSSVEDNNYLGLFAFVYRETTARIKSEIEAGTFQDNVRMHEMDVRFANLYIEAYHDYQNGKSVSRCWAVSFDAANEPLTIIQHIMLGMNAHINLDLAIASASVMDGRSISDLATDFHIVNDVLSSLTNEMQKQLAHVSPLMFLLDWIGHRSDEKVIDFSIKVAREQSWRLTQELWELNNGARDDRIGEIDLSIERIANRIKAPRTRTLGFVLKVIRIFEKKEVSEIIKTMRDVK